MKKNNIIKNIKNKFLKLIIYSFYFTIANFAWISPVFAAEADPLQAINNLNDFIYAVVRVVGTILSLTGLVQLGLALKSHDGTQRSAAILSVVGGIIIICSKPILDGMILKNI